MEGIHSMSDSINPNHYLGENGIECHEAQLAIVGTEGMKAYWTSTALKYIWRWQKKNGVEDLRKAQRCIQFLIDLQTEKA